LTVKKGYKLFDYDSEKNIQQSEKYAEKLYKKYDSVHSEMFGLNKVAVYALVPKTFVCTIHNGQSTCKEKR
jgi:hypothetical protein